jgi:lipopolysaccharide cholinephosphotransferase
MTNVIGGITEDLKACKNVFEKTKISWSIIDGIVLGYVRHNGIIPWDTDVDLAILEEMTQKKWKMLVSALSDQGIKIKPFLRDYIYGKRTVGIGIWIYHKNGNYYEAYPPSTPGLKFVEKAEWYDNIQMVDFLGDKYPMPNNLDDYLNCRYGNWKEEKYTHDQWRVEKFGTINQDVKSQKEIWTKSRCGKKGDLWPKIMFIEDKLSR